MTPMPNRLKSPVHPFQIVRRFFLVALMILLQLLAVLQPVTAQAQSAPNAANCDEISDPDVKFQMELCSAHAGCRMVMNIHNTCVKVKKFLTNLKETIGEGTKTLFGYRKEVTPAAIIDASVSDNFRQMDKQPGVSEALKRIREEANAASKGELKGSTGKNDWVYYGERDGGKPKGVGTIFFSDGEMHRGRYDESGKVTGTAEILQSNGSWRYVGEVDQGRRNGNGVLGNRDGEILQGKFASGRMLEGVRIWNDGTRFEGTFDKNSAPERGKTFRADGTLKEEGVFEGNQLVVGKSYAVNGVDSVEVDKLKEREVAAAAARATEEKRRQETEAQKQAELKRKRDDQVAADQAYRDSLRSMNPGQLFSKADELASNGEREKARDVLRALVSRFPDHPLATQAALQMSGGGASKTSNSGNSGSSGSNVQPSGSGGACWDIIAKKDKEYEALNRKPMPAGATPPLMRIMWMTADLMQVIDSHCAGDAKAAKYRSELQNSYKQAKTACEQMSTGGCTPNPYG